ncbi:hypothetical protein BN1097_610039 [Clostridioides difficile]|uniref:Uncharacterized protein n=1 Tax=Clostridioides difficile TaxID=1496 RepID=A0A069AC51_CLODI|nr:hypothetical protein QO7_1696 [Clostridioides difficile F314]CDS86918.1 hypothetical protein BN1097_610039 [Clostridioides difficile]
MIKNGILFLTNQLYSGGNLYEIQKIIMFVIMSSINFSCGWMF